MLFAPIVLALLALAPQDAKADAATLKAAFEQAKVCGEATVKGDIEKLADFTHPAILFAIGGKAKMVENFKKNSEQMKARGDKLVEIKIEPAKSLTKSETGLYCILPKTTKMSSQGMNVSLEAFLLGVSTDSGKSWKFIDGSLGEDAMRQFVPEIPKGMKFPPKSKPKIEK